MAAWTSETSSGEGERSVISQPEATSRTQVPVLETSAASQMARNTRLRSGAQAPGEADPGAASEGSVRVAVMVSVSLREEDGPGEEGVTPA